MGTRTPSRILEEWRALERQLEVQGDIEMAAELAALRDEYARAVEARRGQATDLGRMHPALRQVPDAG